ncbi:uncharacterized protein NECHADRAFT_75882 [Fusarium vanettenii 77-13-4]|uniref:Zn(2)-C6 fungal-type domain-containing protein n=1 Tax=Fusarium vanettenii (strain ATCC MYA-4622 / CBS 123669 / FGSC 9596 / NRRL 45880 / 77-13-4) TaxID=660122 RepID=C7Z5V4_FUSV7|nr:uncharacterized protein NECHADRAFT_75882 [Fusarium vanettenii 77-13-4]EEU40588.1 hypothetical protein NECHADRAFT_75882 [Fusarium vanettenii 77-13-4]
MHSRTVSTRSSPASDASRARLSCEPCRARKIRCTGEHPVCSKCFSKNRECSYSIQKAAGRPRTRQQSALGRDGRSRRRRAIELVPSPESLLDLSQDTSEPASEPPSSVHETPGSQDNGSESLSGPHHAVPPFLADFESYMHAQPQECSGLMPSLPLGTLNHSECIQPCACLSILYLLLNRIGSDAELVVPNDLSFLRNTVETAMDVLDCVKCPLRFSSVLQNATILGILCVCIAESYVRFVRAIDAKAQAAVEKEESLLVSLSNFEGPPSYPDQSKLGANPAAILVEVSPDQWKSLMHNAVKAEICGVEGHREKCFMHFIERLEERQTDWHRRPLAPDCPPTYQSACTSVDEVPLCLTIIKAARKFLDQIEHILQERAALH